MCIYMYIRIYRYIYFSRDKNRDTLLQTHFPVSRISLIHEGDLVVNYRLKRRSKIHFEGKAFEIPNAYSQR